MLVLLVLLTAPAQARDCKWCHYDFRVGASVFSGATTDGAAFSALALDMKWDLLFPRANIGFHLNMGPSLRTFTADLNPYFGMYAAETVYWQHGPWGVGVGVEAPNAMIVLIAKDSPEFGGWPMLEGWRDIGEHVTVTARIGTDWGRDGSYAI